VVLGESASALLLVPLYWGSCRNLTSLLSILPTTEY